VDSNDDGSDPNYFGTPFNGYSCKSVNEGSCSHDGISQATALSAIKEELSKEKVCCVKLDSGNGADGHTVVCCGIEEGVSLRDATWEDLLFNDVGRGAESNREAKTMTEMKAVGKSYKTPDGGACFVIYDTTLGGN
jgi:hypothetical protein